MILKVSPKVSVVMITYNHKEFIEQAVHSVLRQKTLFEYEVVIGDDCSTDGTSQILMDLAKQYPNKIRLVLHAKNIGVMPNLMEALKVATGEYIALLEGDDYWTSSHKLQTQADYLDQHLECSLCFHAIDVYSEEIHQVIRVEQQVTSHLKLRNFGTYDLRDVLKYMILPRTCTIMYRVSTLKLPEWSTKVINGDTVLTFIAAQSGRLAYLEQNLATYRIHSRGIWSGASSVDKQLQLVTTFGYLNQHFNYVYEREFELRRHYLALALRYQYAGYNVKARKFLWKSLTYRNGGSLTIRAIISALSIIYMPHAYSLYRRLRFTRSG